MTRDAVRTASHNNPSPDVADAPVESDLIFTRSGDTVEYDESSPRRPAMTVVRHDAAEAAAGRSFTVDPARLRLSSALVGMPQRLSLVSVVRALRPRHWVKNILVFVPLLLAHEYTDLPRILSALWAFAAWSCCASAVYVLNDLADIESDRHHPQKRNRPFASGAIPTSWGLPLACLLLGAALSMSILLLPATFSALLIVYTSAASAYSRWLKRLVIVDVLVLSGLYTLRLVAGGEATSVPVSQWLMGFALFLFLSLAFAKRYSELARLAGENATSAKGRGYHVADRGLLESMGPTCGYLAVLVFALYINSEKTGHLYARGWALWMICPLLVYWVSWIWIKARRQELSEDPVLFSIGDRASLVVAALIVALIVVAKPL